jgi:hypothetical protein
VFRLKEIIAQVMRRLRGEIPKNEVKSTPGQRRKITTNQARYLFSKPENSGASWLQISQGTEGERSQLK